jgi:hypothetical protein
MLQGAAEGRRASREGAIEMSKRKVQGVEVEMGTGNVYADLGYGDADEMLQLVAKIAEIIKGKGITQTQAAALLGMATLNALDLDTESQPPYGELAQAKQRMRTGGPGTLNTSSSGLTKSAAKLPLSDSPE